MSVNFSVSGKVLLCCTPRLFPKVLAAKKKALVLVDKLGHEAPRGGGGGQDACEESGVASHVEKSTHVLQEAHDMFLDMPRVYDKLKYCPDKASSQNGEDDVLLAIHFPKIPEAYDNAYFVVARWGLGIPVSSAAFSALPEEERRHAEPLLLRRGYAPFSRRWLFDRGRRSGVHVAFPDFGRARWGGLQVWPLQDPLCRR